jgi:hypothetical protein
VQKNAENVHGKLVNTAMFHVGPIEGRCFVFGNALCPSKFDTFLSNVITLSNIGRFSIFFTILIGTKFGTTLLLKGCQIYWDTVYVTCMLDIIIFSQMVPKLATELQLRP